MKTKTIIRVLSVFFTLTLFFTSCTTEEVAVDEIENTNDANLLNKGSFGEELSDYPVNAILSYLTITYTSGTTKAEKATIRQNYNSDSRGYISHTTCSDTVEVWYVWHVTISGGSNGDGDGADGDDVVSGSAGVEENNTGSCLVI